MLNQILMVGKVEKNLELREASNGRPFSIVTLKVDKENPETGKYETEKIDVSLWGLTAENTAKYAGEGSTVAIRGRAANRVLGFPGEQTMRTIGIVGEQVSFIQLREPGSIKANDLKSETKLPISLNQTILVGRTTDDIELQESLSGRSYANVTLEVKRSFKNIETNEYDSDFIEMTLWDSEAEKVAKYVGKDSALSIRGHLTTKTLESTGQMSFKTIAIVGDKVSYIQIKEPQTQQQITNAQQEIESTNEWIPMSELESNLEKHGDTIDKINQKTKIDSSLEL